jgi:hypothetical protein
MKLIKFSSPGYLNEFNPEFHEHWSNYISNEIDQAIRGFPDRYINDDPRDLMFNQLKQDLSDDAVLKDIKWIAFPRNILISTIGDKQRWKKADSSRDVQDEYCEWSVERNPASGKISRVEFTCEDRVYWHYLWAQSPDLVTELYQKNINLNVKKEDLETADGKYNERNKWNNNTSTGAMHMIHNPNTIGAAIELAAGASNIRVINGKTLTGEQELIKCARYGDPNRNSDPHIGAIANSITRQKAKLTLADPLGLYFDGLITNGWKSPDGTNPNKFWKYTRGAQDRSVRAIYEVPAELNYDVGDIEINGKKIEWGSQIADFINIKIVGVGMQFGQNEIDAFNACKAVKPTPEEINDLKIAFINDKFLSKTIR